MKDDNAPTAISDMVEVIKTHNRLLKFFVHTSSRLESIFSSLEERLRNLVGRSKRAIGN